MKGKSFEEKEFKRYNTLNNRNDIILKIQSNIESDYRYFEETMQALENSIKTISSKIDLSTQTLKTKYFRPLYANTSNKLNAFKLEISYIKEEGEKTNSDYIDRVEALKKRLEDELFPIRAKLQNQKLIKSIEEEIKNERQKLLQISNIEDKIKDLQTNKNTQKQNFLQGYCDAYYEYKNIIKKLNERANSINDIKLMGSIKFYYNRFKKNFLEFFNQKSNELRDFNLLSDRESNSLPNVDFDEHLDEITRILDLILEGKVTYRKYKEVKESVKSLFQDEFFDYWELIIGNDEMANMSPGKANLAVLKLLIELSESNSPILIDQPEDNLDNRSIYTDLVQFIRKRKEKKIGN